MGNIYYLKNYSASIPLKEMREFNKYIDNDKMIGGYNLCWFIKPSLDWIHQIRPYLKKDQQWSSSFYDDVELPKEEFYWIYHKGVSSFYESKNPEWYNITPFFKREFSNKELIYKIKGKQKKGKISSSNNEEIELWKITP